MEGVLLGLGPEWSWWRGLIGWEALSSLPLASEPESPVADAGEFCVITVMCLPLWRCRCPWARVV